MAIVTLTLLLYSSRNNQTTELPEKEVVLTIVELKSDKQIITELVNKYAKEYNVSSYQMLRTIECESNFQNVQSAIVKNNVREDSWGIAQINLFWNPTITKAQALDFDFSVKYMASEFAKGNQSHWYGYNPITDTCNVPYI